MDYFREIFFKTIESKYAYWSALLTFNGILIAVFSAIAIFLPNNKWFALVIMVSAMSASGLIISNYITFKSFFEELSSYIHANGNWTEQEIAEFSEKIETNVAQIDQREKIIHSLLIFEAIMICLLIVLK